ncbi:VOC family protein [Parasphingopyxis marina]|uniref:VOC family protein n=1 Tax=Parasphingopyxis marina TaxID=2761622 RepID=A0A842I2K4_9SPHN|nr:VOC family protein [Parasphingopyxis marina]MBC2778969.1 VOC family protein [Parasphingopyxis marina]
MKIKSLGYIGIGSTDPDAWLAFGTGVLGMMPARAIPGEGWGEPGQPREPTGRPDGVGADGAVYLKMDERQWRIAIHPTDGARDLLYMGLELDGHIELEAAVAELRAAGIEVREGSDEDAFCRAVTGIAYCEDPSGNALELYYGPTTDYNFASPVPGLEFVAGHLGVGHFNLFVHNQAACFDFYTRLLGFKLSDYFRYGPGVALQFLRCNPRHHSIAMIDMGTGNVLQHMLVEMATVDDVGKALDRAKRAGMNVVSALGRHRNDGMFSFYMRSPSGFDVEVGCGGKLLDETWSPNEFCEGDVWGHDGLIEAVIEASEVARARAGQGAP